MKKIFLFPFVLFFIGVSIANSQWTTSGNDIYNSNSGKVGVGSSFNISEKFTVNGNIQLNDYDNSYSSRYIRVLSRLTMQCTSNPTNDWTRSLIGQGVFWDNTNSVWNVDGGSWSDFATIRFENGGAMGFYTRTSTGSSYTMTHSEMSTYQRLFIAGNGNVGIGTSNTGSFKLAVEGKIGAREIKVTLQNPWPDYVFKRNYNLLSLHELEKYIEQNCHLPNMPSAKTVKENDGIELGDLSARLLEKIEELTLYIIQLKKENDKMKQDIEILKQ